VDEEIGVSSVLIPRGSPDRDWPFLGLSGPRSGEQANQNCPIESYHSTGEIPGISLIGKLPLYSAVTLSGRPTAT